MNYTTIKQSKKLLELGLSPESADMVYIMFDGKPLDDDAKLSTVFESKDHKWYWIDFIDGSWDICEEDIPCWSLGALLKLMPTSIEEVKNHKVDLIFGHPKDKWCATYFDWTGLQHGHSTAGDTPLEAAYNMVCWLLENAFLKKE